MAARRSQQITPRRRLRILRHVPLHSGNLPAIFRSLSCSKSCTTYPSPGVSPAGLSQSPVNIRRPTARTDPSVNGRVTDMPKIPFGSTPTIVTSNALHRAAYGNAKHLFILALMATMTACASGEQYATYAQKACLAIQEVRCPLNHAQFVDKWGCASCMYLPRGELTFR